MHNILDTIFKLVMSTHNTAWSVLSLKKFRPIKKYKIELVTYRDASLHAVHSTLIKATDGK